MRGRYIRPTPAWHGRWGSCPVRLYGSSHRHSIFIKTKKIMISKSIPLSDYVQSYRDGGVDVAAYRTSNGKRYALRIVDPENKARGLAFLASFANKVKEAERPGDDDPQAQTKANQALDAILNDPSKMARFVACFCTIDSQSLEQFPDKYTEDDLGREFITISYCGSSESDSYREYEEAKTESKRKSARR